MRARLRSSVSPRASRVTNLQGVGLQSDMVFGEEWAAQQLGIVSGSLDAGLSVYLGVAVTA